MKLKLKVTQEHIDRAVKARRADSADSHIAYICPVAQCIKEFVCPDVVVIFTTFGLIDEGHWYLAGSISEDVEYFTTALASDWSTLEPGTITIEEV